MYDTLGLSLYSDHCPDTNLLQTIPKYLTAIKSTGNTEFGQYVSGYLDNLKIIVSDKAVRIPDSSICKYHFGDNFKTLSRGDTRKAIEKISDCLHLPFSKAKVTRIDFSQNFIMQHPEQLYYPYLGIAPHYRRLEQSNGLMYQNGKRQILFYGKVYEQKIKRCPIPEIYKDRNVLRYELRFTKALTKQFNISELTAATLYDEIFYSNLVTRWKDQYLAIQKIKSKISNMKPTGSKKHFIEHLALFTIQDVGQATILDKVREWQAAGEISKKQAFELRQFLKQTTTIKGPDEAGYELISELTRKVKEAACSY